MKTVLMVKPTLEAARAKTLDLGTLSLCRDALE